MTKNMSLTQKGLLIAAVLLVFQISLFAMLSSLRVQVVEEEGKMDRALQLGTAISSLMMHSLKVTSDSFHEKAGPVPSFDKIREDRRHLLTLERYLSPDKVQVLHEVSDDLDALERLTRRVADYTRVDKFHGRLEAQMKTALKDAALKAIEKSRKLTELVNNDKNRIEETLRRQRENREQTEMVLGIALAIEVLLSAGAMWWFKSDIERRVGTIFKNTFLLAQGKPLLPQVSGNDDIAQLDMVFHEMADALAKAKRDRRAMVDYSRDVICQIDEKFSIRSANIASTSILGCFPEELIGASVAQIIHADDVHSVLDRLKESADSSEQPSFEVRVSNKSGAMTDTLWSTRWSSNDKSFFCVIHDNTQQKRTERLRQEVLQMVNHDLRTPLFTVSSFLEMGQMGVFGQLTDDGKKRLESSLSGTSSMLVLIEDLLDFEKINASMLELSSETVALKQLFDDAVETVREWLPDLEIEIAAEPDPGSLSIQADGVRMQQVMVKLITALGAFSAPDSSLAIRGGLEEPSASDNAMEPGVEHLLITIKLKGGHIPEQVLPGMFDPYADTNEYFARHERNSRMMLAVCRALVELQGGTLTVLNDSRYCGFAIRMAKINCEF